MYDWAHDGGARAITRARVRERSSNEEQSVACWSNKSSKLSNSSEPTSYSATMASDGQSANKIANVKESSCLPEDRQVCPHRKLQDESW